LDLLVWDKTEFPTKSIVQAMPCELHQGVLNTNKNENLVSAHIYVDDALVAAPGRKRIKKAHVACIDAIFFVLGKPDTHVRQCPLAMDKWIGMLISHKKIMLGLVWNTRKMILGIPLDYLAEVSGIITDKWKYKKPFFFVGEIQTLVGKLARLGEGAAWIYKLMSHLYSSVAHALTQNESLLNDSSEEFRELVRRIKSTQFLGKPAEVSKKINFAIKKASQMVHHAKYKHKINQSMREEIKFLRKALQPDSGIKFEMPFAHIIQRTPLGLMFGDSSLRACGGFCLPLRFWRHHDFDEKITSRTLLFLKNNKDEPFISINCLEYLTVIVNYCAAYTVITTENPTADPFPVILSITDNTSALN